MKYVYFDCSSGASGDMILASLLSLGVPVEDFQEAVKGLKLPVEIKITRGKSLGLAGTRVQVRTADDSPARTFDQVSQVIKRSGFEPEIKEKALKVFRGSFRQKAEFMAQVLRGLTSTRQRPTMPW
jgi:uncharacterized protein (DUF111 family)